jgi:Ca2+-binding RTX toxin-like protein
MARVSIFVKDLQMEGAAVLQPISSDKTQAEYELAGGGTIVLVGKNLEVEEGNADELGSGRVTQVDFRNEDGSTGMTISGGKYSAKAIGDAATDNGAFGIYSNVLFEGNDKIQGSGAGQSIWGGEGDDEIKAAGGKDILYGQDGDDELWGGNGSDTFLFYDEAGNRDVIHDLDIKGKDADILAIGEAATVEKIRSANNGEDTRLFLSTDSTILIKDVNKSDFVDYWESLAP